MPLVGKKEWVVIYKFKHGDQSEIVRVLGPLTKAVAYKFKTVISGQFKDYKIFEIYVRKLIDPLK